MGSAYLFKNISYETLLGRVASQGIPVGTGTKNNPKPVIVNVTEVEAVVMITKVSSIFDSKKTLTEVYFFVDFYFSSLK